MQTLPDGPFACVMADPPWRFGDQGTRASPEYAGTQRPEAHYTTMSLDHVCALPVADVVAPDAWLFLWVPEALRESPYNVAIPGTMFPRAGTGYHRAVAEAWGFEVTGSVIVWVKGRPVLLGDGRGPATGAGLALNIGMGHYARNAHEPMIICKRGSPVRRSASVPSVIVAPRTQHSAKPIDAYEAIEEYCDGPRLELFARQHRDGWTSWGDQV